MKPFDDVYHRESNRIPYCELDARQLLKKEFEKDGIAVGRSVLQAISETAECFMEEVTSKPFFLTNQKPTLPRIFMSNIKDKFPELSKDAAKLYTEHLQKWDKPNLFLQRNYDKYESKYRKGKMKVDDVLLLDEVEKMYKVDMKKSKYERQLDRKRRQEAKQRLDEDYLYESEDSVSEEFRFLYEEKVPFHIESDSQENFIDDEDFKRERRKYIVNYQTQKQEAKNDVTGRGYMEGEEDRQRRSSVNHRAKFNPKKRRNI